MAKYLVKRELRGEITHAGLRMPVSGEVVPCLAEVGREFEVADQKAGLFPAGPPCEDPYRVPGDFSEIGLETTVTSDGWMYSDVDPADPDRPKCLGKIKTELDQHDLEYERDAATVRNIAAHVPGMLPQAVDAAVNYASKMSLATPLIQDREEIERICQTPEADRMASEPLDLKKDLVTYADHQIFSTELERRLDEIGLLQKPPDKKMKCSLEFGSWMVPHRRIIHTPDVKVTAKSDIPRSEYPKDPGPQQVIEHVDRYFQQRCNPLPLTPSQILDLPTQEAMFYNGGRRYPETVDEGTEVKTFSEVTITEYTPTYAPEEIAALGPDTFVPELECPMHFFGKPEGDWTGTTVQVRSAGSYYTENGIVQMEAGTFKVYKTMEDAISKHKEVIRRYKKAKVWFEKVQGYDMTEVMRLRIGRQIRNSIQYNLSSHERRVRYGIPNPETIAEQKARDLLRDMLSEADWRRYVTNAFIMVRGASGKWYQIFRVGGVHVWLNGERYGSICIHTEGGCPPTDHVISMKLLIEFEEDAIFQEGNFRPAHSETISGPPEFDSKYRIPEIPRPPNLIETVRILRHGKVI